MHDLVVVAGYYDNHLFGIPEKVKGRGEHAPPSTLEGVESHWKMADTLEEFIRKIAHYEGAPRIGAKFWETRNLDIKEIATLVRKEIKEDVANDVLPNQKYSVRIERYRGGQSISVETENNHGKWKAKKDPNRRFDPADVRLRLQYLLDQYNYDGSHGIYDWSDKRFYSDVKLS